MAAYPKEKKAKAAAKASSNKVTDNTEYTDFSRNDTV